jgi:hypothetical protein
VLVNGALGTIVDEGKSSSEISTSSIFFDVEAVAEEAEACDGVDALVFAPVIIRK